MTAPLKPALADARSESFVARLSQLLVERGFANELDVARAQRASQASSERFDLALSRLGLVDDARLLPLLAELTGYPLAAAGRWPSQAVEGIDVPPAFLKSNRIVPLGLDDGRVRVAMADPFNLEPTRTLSFLIERPVTIELAPATEIERHIDRLYGPYSPSAASAKAGLSDDVSDASEDDVRRLQDMASEAPVIRLVQSLVERAVAAKASDIHIEPREDSVRVRCRIDGVLHVTDTLPVSMRAALTSRIKIMAQLNIAERRLPQDGRIRINVRGRDIDLRVSTMPAMGGESVVLRILDRETVALDFASLGFEGKPLAILRERLAEPNGIILVTGPTGSGKTTTLYTALGTLNSTESKVFTVEDPVEYRLDGINQIQVAPKIGLTFASALRSILRQDPDIVMVGEIRDLETAEIAIRASLTGHLVLSTVHTNSAAATIVRLLDMGVEDYLMASSLKAVVAQRLVRCLCPACSQPAAATPALVSRLRQWMSEGGGEDHSGAPNIRTAKGCAECRNTGFAGRTTIYEVLTITTALRDALLGEPTEAAIEAAARESGVTPMLANGAGKVWRGITTLEEVLRVTRSDSHAAI